MKQQGEFQFDPQVFAVMHRAGGAWRCVIAGAKGGKPAILATREFRLGSAGGVDPWLSEHRAASVLCVLPASSVICRTSALPDAPQQQLEQALRLQAEAHLLGIAAPHRLAMAVQPGATGESSRTGIILAWPESASFQPPPTNRPVTYVPDVAALAAILNGERPTKPIVWMDRSDGSVALAMTHAGGVVFRATREDAASNEAWQQSVGRILAETALSVGHTGAFIDGLVPAAHRMAGSLDQDQAMLFVPPELILSTSLRLQGTSEDSTWWSHYGIAVGAVLARTGALAPLTALKEHPPIERPSRIRTTLEAMSRPRTAIAVVAACLLILMLGPLAASGLRLLMLEWRFANIQNELASASKVKHQLAMYRELQRQDTWPMTKLLADITTNTPLGIDLERIQIEAGKDFSVSGTAHGYDGRGPTQVVALMQENLRKDGLFSDISVSWGSSSNLGTYKFDLSGRVPQPFFEPRYPEDRDFKIKPYAHYLYPQLAAGNKPSAPPSDEPDFGAEPTDETGEEPVDEQPILATTDGVESGDVEAVSGRGRRTGSTDAGGDAVAPGDDAAEGLPPSQEIPPELTEEQINAMSLTEANEAWVKVSKARRYAKGDEQLSARLKKEFDLITAHVKKLRSGGS